MSRATDDLLHELPEDRDPELERVDELAHSIVVLVLAPPDDERDDQDDDERSDVDHAVRQDHEDLGRQRQAGH